MRPFDNFATFCSASGIMNFSSMADCSISSCRSGFAKVALERASLSFPIRWAACSRYFVPDSIVLPVEILRAVLTLKFPALAHYLPPFFGRRLLSFRTMFLRFHDHIELKSWADAENSRYAGKDNDRWQMREGFRGHVWLVSVSPG
jgi:hypothetical protein